MVKNHLSRSCYNAFCHLQLQSRVPGASQHHSCFAACSRDNAFCHSRLQTRKAGASHQIDQHSRSADNRPPIPQVFAMFTDLNVKSRSRYSLGHILPTPSSKSAPTTSIFTNIVKCKSSSLVVCTFCPPHLPKVLCARQLF